MSVCLELTCADDHENVVAVDFGIESAQVIFKSWLINERGLITLVVIYLFCFANTIPLPPF